MNENESWSVRQTLQQNFRLLFRSYMSMWEQELHVHTKPRLRRESAAADADDYIPLKIRRRDDDVKAEAA